MQINIFEEVFLSTDMWGLFGVLALIAVSFVVIKRERALGVFFILAQFIIMAQYFTLVSTTPAYWWNIIFLILGVITCAAQMAD